MARKPAARRGASKSAASQRIVPGWVWLFTGVAAGLFIAFLFHLGQLQLDTERTPRTAKAPEAEAKPPKDSDSRGPRFDFYAVLPQMEVIMPKGDDDTPQPARPSRGTPPPADNGTDDSQVAHRHSEHFLLQAGSFRRSEDADRRRAELILQGLDARVQPVSLESGDTWHRVMIGPFTNANAMHRVQDQLVGVGIETLAIRVRDPDA
ncbi:MAG: cell division protein [Alcanivorax sp.]|nr:cell division protein [Alcanivorax sp.]